MNIMKYLSLVVLFACVAVSNVRADFQSSLLKELHGVGLKARPMILQSKVFELDEAILEQHALDRLGELNVGVLAGNDYQVLPGEPFLELGLSIVQAQGPSHIYSISLSLRERAELDRPKASVVSIVVSTWERESLGIANGTEAVFQALDRLLGVFAEEFHRVNGSK